MWVNSSNLKNDANLGIKIGVITLKTLYQYKIMLKTSKFYFNNEATDVDDFLVVNRAKVAFEAIQSLSAWIDPNSKTKTQYIYESDANFCD